LILPDAVLVYDRFHVVKLLNEKLRAAEGAATSVPPG
jgi:transposase